MTGSPIWYELMTADPGAISDFYRAVVGWTIPARGEALPGGTEYCLIERGGGGHAGGVLSLSQAMLAGGARPGWMTYFHTGDVDASVQRAESLGAPVHMPATTMEGVGRLAMLSDPTGGHFYLMSPTPPPDQPDAQSDVFDSDKPGHCRWNELQTPDEPTATAFYKGLFDWQTDNAMPMGDKGFYRFVETEGRAIGAINPWMAEGSTAGWLPYFGVADIDIAKAAAEAAGGVVTHDVHEVPGGEFIFTANDPAGAPVAFVGPRGAIS
jgi:predicted enzyme related to lactoylglutathione lyase